MVLILHSNLLSLYWTESNRKAQITSTTDYIDKMTCIFLGISNIQFRLYYSFLHNVYKNIIRTWENKEMRIVFNKGKKKSIEPDLKMAQVLNDQTGITE